jgi:hypothetical protein
MNRATPRGKQHANVYPTPLSVISTQMSSAGGKGVTAPGAFEEKNEVAPIIVWVGANVKSCLATNVI